MIQKVIDSLPSFYSLVNYVLETEGARHMHHSSKHLNILQYHGIDVMCTVFVLLLVIALAGVSLSRRIRSEVKAEKQKCL